MLTFLNDYLDEWTFPYFYPFPELHIHISNYLSTVLFLVILNKEKITKPLHPGRRNWVSPDPRITDCCCYRNYFIKELTLDKLFQMYVLTTYISEQVKITQNSNLNIKYLQNWNPHFMKIAASNELYCSRIWKGENCFRRLDLASERFGLRLFTYDREESRLVASIA